MRRQMPTRAERDTSWVQPQPEAFRMPRSDRPHTVFAMYFEQKQSSYRARVRLRGRGCSRTLHEPARPGPSTGSRRNREEPRNAPLAPDSVFSEAAKNAAWMADVGCPFSPC